MYVCANCAQRSVELLRTRAALAILRMEIDKLRLELHDTERAFWDLAGDVRLNPVAVNVTDNYVSVIFPADDAGERQVS